MPPNSGERGAARLGRLREKLAQQGVDALLVTAPENRRYISGFTGSAGVAIVTRSRQALATDSRYYQQVKQECPDWSLIEAGYDFDSRLPEYLADMRLEGGNVGFESAHVSVDRHRRWQSCVADRAELVACPDVIADLRACKDDREVNSIRRAVALADDALVHVFGWLRPGLTEREIQWELESHMRLHGAEGIAFDTIVAAGANGALPHATPGDQRVEVGEPILMDLGCLVDGYASDVTRAVCLGTPKDERYLELWHLVNAARETAVRGLHAGISGVAGDGLAREVIGRAGYGQYFGHSLGHGVGLAVHELPRLSYAAPEPIPAGSVLSVEPGVYIPGWGGIRLEDLVWVTESGVEVLTKAPLHAVL